MFSNREYTCPLCFNNHYTELKKTNLKTFDESILYDEINIVSCDQCGHVYNLLKPCEATNLVKFYEVEHEELVLGKVHTKVQNIRNENLYSVVEPFLSYDTKILDIGCGDGSFLKFLQQQKYLFLNGFELAKKSVDNINGFNIDTGNAQNLPYDNGSYDCIVMDQFLEHVVHPKVIMQEVYRVLSDDGTVVIGVPDAADYSRFDVFPFFYLILKEHIQHFDSRHIDFLSQLSGFSVVKTVKTVYPMHTLDMKMSNLYVVLKKTKIQKVQLLFDPKKLLKEKLIGYIASCDKILIHHMDKIKREMTACDFVYFWGIGREFFLIYSMLNEDEKQKCLLVDANINKQKAHSVDKKNILSPEILLDGAQGLVIVTAIYHTKTIKDALDKSSFVGKIYTLIEEL